jgi:chromate transporter
MLSDIPSILIALATIGVLLKFKKIPEPLIILVDALIGVLIKSFG